MSIRYLVFWILLTCSSVIAQPQGYNYDESQVPDYTLPEILISESGEMINSVDKWETLRRPELLRLFASQVYGKVPEAEVKVSFTKWEQDKDALSGLATRKQIIMRIRGNGQTQMVHLLIYIPNEASKPVPSFLGINFYGNHTIHPDPEIVMTGSWVRNNESFGITENQATEASRGVRASRWPVEMILKRGYALANIYYGDIDPDYDDYFQNGIHPLFYQEDQSKPLPDEWGSIGAWAWGMSKALDYLIEDNEINGEQVAVLGHSRLGKTSLWAGTTDPRFSMVITNDSGCGGAALSRRKFGETVQRINTSFPHWFCDNFVQYNDNEAELPIDQHQLISLIAPRPVYVASAEEDLWADPKGEYLSAYHATKVYELYNLKGLSSEDPPPTDQPLKTTQIGYHRRSGGHDVTDYDWEQFLDFADLHFK